MSRYIDADALKERIREKMGIGSIKYLFPNERAIVNEIDYTPSIEIIRCKECKWAEPNREGDYDCKCHIPTFRIKADDFCSYGERREP